jgi:Clp amino terminal domain, pathogenicity island component
MTETPVHLDGLISYVKAQHPGGGPLDHLSDAVLVGARLDEQADALIGHFVDRARRSGASWSEIGASMGVSKQAAQKKFVFRWEDLEAVTPGGRFSRFTDRARSCVLAAHTAARAAGAPAVDVAHLVVGLMAEPGGLAAIIIHAAGVTDDQIRAPSAGSAQPADQETTADRLPSTDALKSAFNETLHAALSLGHNYIGTEHLLLGILAEEGDTSAKLNGLGITARSTREELTVQFAKFKAEHARLAPDVES